MDARQAVLCRWVRREARGRAIARCNSSVLISQLGDVCGCEVSRLRDVPVAIATILSQTCVARFAVRARPPGCSLDAFIAARFTGSFVQSGLGSLPRLLGSVYDEVRPAPRFDRQNVRLNAHGSLAPPG